MESVIAAAYLDGGLEAARDIIGRLILCYIPEQHLLNADYKTALQELVQRKPGRILSYHLIGESGPDHDKRFTVQVCLDDQPVGTGEGSSKKRAEQAAAHSAMQALFPGEYAR